MIKTVIVKKQMIHFVILIATGLLQPTWVGLPKEKQGLVMGFAQTSGELREKSCPLAVPSEGCTNAVKLADVLGLLQLQPAEMVCWQLSFACLCCQFKQNKQIDLWEVYSSLLKTMKLIEKYSHNIFVRESVWDFLLMHNI